MQACLRDSVASPNGHGRPAKKVAFAQPATCVCFGFAELEPWSVCPSWSRCGVVGLAAPGLGRPSCWQPFSWLPFSDGQPSIVTSPSAARLASTSAALIVHASAVRAASMIPSAARWAAGGAGESRNRLPSTISAIR